MDFPTRIETAFSKIMPNQSLFLGGSHGYGTADEYSDFDFVVVCAPDDFKAMAERWKALLESIEPLVLWQQMGNRHVVINAITQSWVRCDLSIVEGLSAPQFAQNTLVPMQDPNNLYNKLPQSAPAPTRNPAMVRYLIREFLRVLGLAAVVMGRKEHLVSVTGLFLQRNHLISLMTEEANPVYRGGALHLNRLLNDDQQMVLQSLPMPSMQNGDLIKCHLEYARAFLPRARRLAKELDVEWPSEFEAATWAYLQRELKIDKPEWLGNA